MSSTPAQAGPGGAGGTFPKRPVAYPTPKSAPAGAAATNPAAPPQAASAVKPAPVSTTVPGNGSASHAPGGKSASAVPAKPAKPDLFSQRYLIAGGAAAAALVLLIALLVWRPWQPKPPRLNEQPYKIAQFTATSAMDRLPWSQQREYMKVLDSKDEALATAYKEGKLSDQEYRRAKQLGWYGKHLDRMDKYFNRAPALRIMYIDEKVLGKKYKKNAPPGTPAIHPPGKKEKPKKDEEKSDDASPLKPEEIDRDDSTEEQDIKKWPGEVQQKWTEYRGALAARKEFFKELERQEKEKRKAAEAKAKSGTAPATGTDAGTTGGSASPDAGAAKAADAQ